MREVTPLLTALREHYSCCDAKGLAFYAFNPVDLYGKYARGDIDLEVRGGVTVVFIKSRAGHKQCTLMARPSLTAQGYVQAVSDLTSSGYTVLNASGQFGNFYGSGCEKKKEYPQVAFETPWIYEKTPSRDKTYVNKCDKLLVSREPTDADLPVCAELNRQWYVHAKKRHKFLVGKNLYSWIVNNWRQVERDLVDYRPRFKVVQETTGDKRIVGFAVSCMLSPRSWSNLIRRYLDDTPRQTCLWMWQKASDDFKDVPISNDGPSGSSKSLAAYKKKAGAVEFAHTLRVTPITL